MLSVVVNFLVYKSISLFFSYLTLRFKIYCNKTFQFSNLLFETTFIQSFRLHWSFAHSFIFDMSVRKSNFLRLFSVDYRVRKIFDEEVNACLLKRVWKMKLELVDLSAEDENIQEYDCKPQVCFNFLVGDFRILQSNYYLKHTNFVLLCLDVLFLKCFKAL